MGPTRRELILPIAVLLAGAAILTLPWQGTGAILLGMAVAVVLAPIGLRLSPKVPGWLSALGITLVILAAAAGGLLFTVTIMQGNLAANAEILLTAARGIGIIAKVYAELGIPVPMEAVQGALAGVEGLVGAIGGFWSGLSLETILLSPAGVLFFAALFLSLWQGDRALRWALVRLPQGWLPYYPRLAAVSVDTIYAVLVVHLILVGLTFAVCVPFFWILGYGHVLSLSTATAICELVPVLGASVPMVILLLYSFAIGDLRGFLLVFLIGYLVIALLPELTLRPILMGRRAHLSPVIMFLGFTGGILILGTAGFLIGPLILAVAVTWWRIRRERAAGEATGT